MESEAASLGRRKWGDDWLSWPEVREVGRERGLHWIWKLGYLAECAVAAISLRRWYAQELIRANVDIGWVIHVDQCSETIAPAIHLPLRLGQHSTGWAYGRQADLLPDYMHVLLPAASSLGCLHDSAYKCILFNGIQFVLSHSLSHTSASNNIR